MNIDLAKGLNCTVGFEESRGEKNRGVCKGESVEGWLGGRFLVCCFMSLESEASLLGQKNLGDGMKGSRSVVRKQVLMFAGWEYFLYVWLRLAASRLKGLTRF